MCGRARNSRPADGVQALLAADFDDLDDDGGVDDAPSGGGGGGDGGGGGGGGGGKPRQAGQQALPTGSCSLPASASVTASSSSSSSVSCAIVRSASAKGLVGWQMANRENLCPGSYVPVLRHPASDKRHHHHDHDGSQTAGKHGGGSGSRDANTASDDAPKAAPAASRAEGTSAQPQPQQPQEPLLLDFVRWGLIPSYTKPGEPHNYFRMFNARSETVLSNRVFARLAGRRRCVVVLEGFYEWQKKAHGLPSQPYYLHDPTRPLLYVAGLYDELPVEVEVEAEGDGGASTEEQGGEKMEGSSTATTTAGEAAIVTEAEATAQGIATNEPDKATKTKLTVLRTCTMMTMDAGAPIRWLHDRQPVILPDAAAVRAWLDPATPPQEAWMGAVKAARRLAAADATKNQRRPTTSTAAAATTTTTTTGGGGGGGGRRRGEPGTAGQPSEAPPLGVVGGLVVHPVTPKMTSTKYRATDASRNMQARKSSIMNLFAAAGKKKKNQATSAVAAAPRAPTTRGKRKAGGSGGSSNSRSSSTSGDTAAVDLTGGAAAAGAATDASPTRKKKPASPSPRKGHKNKATNKAPPPGSRSITSFFAKKARPK